MTTIVLVEDEEAIAEAVSRALEREGWWVLACGDGDHALGLINEGAPDLIILDLILPGRSGLEICRALRAAGNRTPILMLTALGAEADKVAGLELGADDYVTKPFGMRELVARVRAHLRRAAAHREAAGQGYRDELLTIDLDRHVVRRAGAVVELAPKEFALLAALVEAGGRVVDRNRLLDTVWGGDDFIDHRTVDVHVRWLRRKLEPDPAAPRYIVTVRGSGYRFGGGG